LAIPTGMQMRGGVGHDLSVPGDTVQRNRHGFLHVRQKTGVVHPVLCGLALMIYPYFVTNTLPLIGVGAVLVAIPWFVRL